MPSALGFIDLFRAIAAFWVLAAHCMIWGGGSWGLPSAKVAVDLFMLISGFLMAANAAARSTSEPLTDIAHWPRFWMRRFFRIAPAYYLSLALAFALGDHFLGGYKQLQLLMPERWTGRFVYDPMRIDYDVDNLMMHLSFVFGLHPTYSMSTFLPDWSLGLEMQFYLMFPLLLLATHNGHSVRRTLMLAVPAYILGVWIQRRFGYYEPSLLPFKLHCFLAGMLIFDVLNRVHEGRPILVSVAGTLIVISLGFGGAKSDTIALLSIAASMIGLGYMELAVSTPPRLKRLLAAKIVRFAADSSYVVYLFHGFFISAAGWIFSRSAYLQAVSPSLRAAVLLLCVATLSYACAVPIRRYLELPGIRLGQWLIRRQTAPDVVAVK